jgi:hypothetical protein
MSLVDEFMKDSAVTEVSTNELQDISALAQQQLEWEQKITQMEVDLSHAKDALRQIQEFLLPEAMAAVGISKFTLATGGNITIKDDVFASIRKDFMNQAVGWLDSNGLGGIVKDKVEVDFGRGELDNVSELLVFCKSNGLNASEKLSVHPQTLKATVKEQLAKGVEFPEEFFSVGPIKKAVIKLK